MGPVKRGSTVGRPRKLTDEQVAAVLRWHETIEALKVLHAYVTPVREFAARLGVTRGAITSIVKQRGVYKQPCPSAKARKP